MASSAVEICNSALIKLGADTINDLTDNNNRAKACSTIFEIKRDELLRSHPWNFAIDRIALGLTANTPAYQFDFEYLIPADTLRILEIDVEAIDADYSIETNSDGDKVLLTNEADIIIKRIKKVTDVSLFDANFCEVLAWVIARDISYRLTQSSTVLQLMTQQAERSLREARSFDAQEGGVVKQVDASEWFNSRF